MKKIFVVGLVLTLILALAACSSGRAKLESATYSVPAPKYVIAIKRKPRRVRNVQTEAEKKAQNKRITFKLESTGGKEAILVGDFNGWDENKHIMKKDKKGMWTKIVTLAPGRYEYKFLVDG